MMFKIARELLEVEHARLLGDHYDDAEYPDDLTCDGCRRASEARIEIAQLSSATREGGYAHVDLTAGNSDLGALQFLGQLESDQ